MNVLSPSLRPTALQSVEAALSEVAAGTTAATGMKPHLQAAGQALDGYAGHTRAIEFDRPDRDVSEHGRALRGQSDRAWDENEAVRLEVQTLTGTADRLKQHVADALGSCPASKPKARQYLEMAQADLQLIQDNALRDAQRGVKYSEKAVRTELSPYLTEVEEDGPGRDVGRFADDLNHWLSEASLSFRHGGLCSDWLVKDLSEVKTRLEAARKNL